jgi:glycine/D-amino acid oxidase-like deaminating enzyme
MNGYDWIVIGGGITGAALAYELTQQNLKVLLLEKDSTPDNATRYSYGGLAYWAANEPETQQLGREGLEAHRNLAAELGSETEFREIDLLLTITRDENADAIADNYKNMAIAPQRLDPQAACDCEPLLNADAIAGALHFPHAHIHPDKTTRAYHQAFQRQGGTLRYETALEIVRQHERATGVKTPQQTYTAAHTVVCAGGLSRSLLNASGVRTPIYFTHAELIETPPVALNLRAMIMPARMQRFELEARATQTQGLWDNPGCEPATPILDPGAIQFRDGHLRLGQISRTLTDPHAPIDAAASEAKMRACLAELLPKLAPIPGQWHHCLVAFSSSFLPRIGPLDGMEGLHLFSGFTNTLVYVPPLAKRFARWAAKGS